MQRTQLKAQDATEANFGPFGQLVGPEGDGKVFDSADARLVLCSGPTQPRFYIMNLPHRGRTFDRITYHAQCTQCLGALAPVTPWFLVVAAPTHSVDAFPRTEDLHAFRIPHGVFVKLEQGTWHAGPLFDGPEQSFFNLELADTNVTDHNAHSYGEGYEVVD